MKKIASVLSLLTITSLIACGSEGTAVADPGSPEGGNSSLMQASSSSEDVVIIPCEEYTDGETFCDTRDSQVYKQVEIDGLVWMAENLKYSGDDGNGGKAYTLGVCPDSATYDEIEDDDHSQRELCESFGRFYTFSEILAEDDAAGYWCDTIPGGCQVRGICPEGWHIANHSEYIQLADFVNQDNGVLDSVDNSGQYLKDTETWVHQDSLTSEDTYGFSALASGSFHNGRFKNWGEDVTWWRPRRDNLSGFYKFAGYRDDSHVLRASGGTNTDALPIRCVRD